jgi:hypothetical protein
MTLARLEQRVLSLEKTVEKLQAQLVSRTGGAPASDAQSGLPGEDDIIPGAEYPVVLNVPPEKVIHLKARLTWIRPGPTGLALSDSEWANLQLEADDE